MFILFFLPFQLIEKTRQANKLKVDLLLLAQTSIKPTQLLENYKLAKKYNPMQFEIVARIIIDNLNLYHL